MRGIFKILFLSLALFPIAAGAASTQTAYFAGGCFWCMTPPFEKLKGVLKVNTAGYADGQGTGATYDDYAEKGFTETVEITFDPAQISYTELLGVLWKQKNPTAPDGQLRTAQYRSAIYVSAKKAKPRPSGPNQFWINPPL